MTHYRDALPQLGQDLFLTDSGLETELIYNQGLELPHFAAFPLLDDADGRQRLRSYFASHAAIAAQADVGLILESVTWRANADWGELLGYGTDALDQVNRKAIDLLVELRAEYADTHRPYPISGCVGPRGDGYAPSLLMTADVARAYHRPQITTFADTQADLMTAMTLAYPDEAIGITQAAREVDMPVVLSFTLETDGNLPDGSTLAAAIQTVDDATDAYPAYYMINCAHPSHLAPILEPDAPWAGRIRALRANASRKSHAELDAATELDSGDPIVFGREYADLRSQFPHLTILGGCCGTDLRHIEQIAAMCFNDKHDAGETIS
jgi:S-methylmethionine-dependent homocysteine/selenocysteine methylase